MIGVQHLGLGTKQGYKCPDGYINSELYSVGDALRFRLNPEKSNTYKVIRITKEEMFLEEWSDKSFITIVAFKLGFIYSFMTRVTS